jgi:hypothetical protein
MPVGTGSHCVVSGASCLSTNSDVHEEIQKRTATVALVVFVADVAVEGSSFNAPLADRSSSLAFFLIASLSPTARRANGESSLL